VNREEELCAKQRLVAAMQEGQRWHDAVLLAGLPLHRSAVYHLVKRVRTIGEEAYIDHRHGHPSKMRAPLCDWLVAYCRQYPDHSARLIQTALRSEYGLSISIGHINYLRRQLGIGRGKKSSSNRRGVRERRKCPAAGSSARNGPALRLRRGPSSSF